MSDEKDGNRPIGRAGQEKTMEAQNENCILD